jgi:hypothetical protein
MDYVDRAGGLTESANYVLVQFPNRDIEEHGTGWFARNPTVDDGSAIIVTNGFPAPASDARS